MSTALASKLKSVPFPLSFPKKYNKANMKTATKTKDNAELIGVTSSSFGSLSRSPEPRNVFFS
jgi:hypothetical protein